jgi:hypothetical protein
LDNTIQSVTFFIGFLFERTPVLDNTCFGYVLLLRSILYEHPIL